MFRHASRTEGQTRSVRALPIRVIEPALNRALMTAASFTERLASHLSAAATRAISVTPIAAATEVEHLTANHSSAGHETK